jgi:hypothetical protein
MIVSESGEVPTIGADVGQPSVGSSRWKHVASPVWQAGPAGSTM